LLGETALAQQQPKTARGIVFWRRRPSLIAGWLWQNPQPEGKQQDINQQLKLTSSNRQMFSLSCCLVFG
jgi:hypothetical protein